MKAITIEAGSRRHTDGLWAITSYFNPMSYRRRRDNYRIFRKHLNLPLVSVEAGFGAFELSDDDAEILIRIPAGDVLWQKERLLNEALRALPNDCSKLVWLDCDIVFGSPDWSERLSRALDQFLVVQPFKHAHHMPPESSDSELIAARAEFSRPSFGTCIVSGASAAEVFEAANNRPYSGYAMGLAWAVHRDVVEGRGFYDACIMGGGDRAMAAAYHGCFDHIINRQCMHEPERQWYLDWAKPSFDRLRGSTSHLDGDIFHLWHGDLVNRRAHIRHKEFSRFAFDPSKDIAISAHGCWNWNSSKSEMHEFVRSYFGSRREDG